MNAWFYLLAVLTLGGAIASMSFRNPVHCALCLVVTFVGLAGFYLALGAEFLGLAQVLVYVGAVAILLVFVLLLTRSSSIEVGAGRGGLLWGITVGVLIAAVLVGASLSEPRLPERSAPAALPTVRETGQALMTEFILPLQVVGVLLTAAMIGAAILALREPKEALRRSGS
jgi:NADH-quinone oxidoreductase subunit J